MQGAIFIICKEFLQIKKNRTFRFARSRMAQILRVFSPNATMAPSKSDWPPAKRGSADMGVPEVISQLIP